MSDYLRMARGVRCDEDQVIVTAGSQQALDLIVACCSTPAMLSRWKTPAAYRRPGDPRQALACRSRRFQLTPKGWISRRLSSASPPHAWSMSRHRTSIRWGSPWSLPRRLALLEGTEPGRLARRGRLR